MTHYLVTGGLGFIGSTMVELIRERDPHSHITILDKLTYAGNLNHVEGIEAHRAIADLCDPHSG